MSKTYTPTRGKAIITPEQQFTDTGLIVIPERFKAKKKAVARVVIWSKGIRMKCAGCGFIQYSGSTCRNCQRPNMKMLCEHPTSPFAGDITGLRVLYAQSSLSKIDDNMFVIPIDDIIAIIGDEVDLDNAENVNGVKRCVYCGPAKPGSNNGMILTTQKGVLCCPRCGKDESGVKVL